MPAVHALLIGINQYAPGSGLTALRGCVPDVLAVRERLVRQLGVPEAHVRSLIEDTATRDAILSAWRTHLIEQPAAGDVAYVHYSGHGSMARSADPASPSGFDESLVAWDSRLDTGRDLRDAEIALLLAEAQARGIQTILFLDCCHAGGATRSDDAPGGILVRACPPDLRPAPSPLPAPARDHAGPAPVVLAACLDEEKAAESATPDGWHGATTWAFLRALDSAHPGVTWGEMHDAIAAGVRSRFTRQTPQISGPPGTPLLGGAGAAQEAYLTVLDVQGTRIQIDGGTALGITPGTRLSITPPGTAADAAPLVQATVEEAEAGSAWAVLDRSASVLPAARARILALGYEALRAGVATDDAALRTALNARLERARFVRPAQDADPVFRVQVESGRIVVADAAGEPLARTDLGSGDTEHIVRALEHLALFRNVRLLRNHATDPALRGTFFVSEPQAARTSRGSAAAAGQPLPRTGGIPVARPGQRIGFDVANQSDQRLFVTVLGLAPDFSIVRLEPVDTRQETLGAGHTLPVSVRLPALPPDATQGAFILKVCVTSVPVSFDSLMLPPLREGRAQTPGAPVRDAGPLSWLLDAVRRTGTRPVRPLADNSADDQWLTHETEILLHAG